jgi:hypothetical protein
VVCENLCVCFGRAICGPRPAGKVLLLLIRQLIQNVSWDVRVSVGRSFVRSFIHSFPMHMHMHMLIVIENGPDRTI